MFSYIFILTFASDNDKQKDTSLKSRYSILSERLKEKEKKIEKVNYDGSPRSSTAYEDDTFISTKGMFEVPWPSEKSVYPLWRDDGKSIY